MSELFDELGDSRKRAATTRQSHRKKKRIRTAIALFISVALVVLAVVVALPYVKSVFESEEAADYPGPGTGEVVITIPDGSTGTQIADILVAENVVASREAFVSAFNNDPRSGSIQSGSYQLRKEMSGQDAVTVLLDPASRALLRITIPEGFTKQQVIDRLANVLETDAASIETILANPATIGLPEEAGGDIEGWISPLTYDFAPDVTAEEVLSTMISQRVGELENLGIPREDWERTLIVASIVEREVNWPEYYGQVARVVENRLEDQTQVNGRLQMDSTVLYGVGKTGGVPTREDLDNDNPYNTYIHPGLPPTPIANPSVEVIEASINPPEGDWLYFVTVNLDTGDTLFSSSLDEHNTYVQQLRDWVAENGEG